MLEERPNLIPPAVNQMNYQLSFEGVTTSANGVPTIVGDAADIHPKELTVLA